MRVYAPSDDSEFERVLGDLTEAECGEIVRRLEAEDTRPRFLVVQDEHWMPTVRRFTLSIHRDDREQARSSIYDSCDADRSQATRDITRWVQLESQVAALIRQYMRAQEANDTNAVWVAHGDILLSLQWLILHLIDDDAIRGSVDIWLDGIKDRSFTTQAPFGITILGEIYCGRASDGTQGLVPFAAELATSADAPALDRLVVRFGLLEELIARRCIQPGQPEHWLGREKQYRLRSGVQHAYFAGSPLMWAIELVK